VVESKQEHFLTGVRIHIAADKIARRTNVRVHLDGYIGVGKMRL
jgi:hypothetical protein